MRTIHRRRWMVIAVTLASSLIAVAGQGPSSARRSHRRTNRQEPRGGAPDLQGILDQRHNTPLEATRTNGGQRRCSQTRNGGRWTLALHKMRTALRDQGTPGRTTVSGWKIGPGVDRTSLIVDPPDGRLPRSHRRRKRKEDALEPLDGSLPVRGRIELVERCITRGMPGAMMPGFTITITRLLQTPNYVRLQCGNVGLPNCSTDGRAYFTGHSAVARGIHELIGRVIRSSWKPRT